MSENKEPQIPSAAEKAAAITSAEPMQQACPPRLAIIQLLPSRFSIAGPIELVLATQRLIDQFAGADQEVAKYRMIDMWDDQGWCVKCSIRDDWIKLSELKYWDVDIQNCYSNPALVPQPVWVESKEDFEGRMNALLDKHRAAPHKRKHH